MNTSNGLWAAVVIGSGAVVHSAGVIANAIEPSRNIGDGSMNLGIFMIFLGLVGPPVRQFLKKSYDSAQVDHPS